MTTTTEIVRTSSLTVTLQTVAQTTVTISVDGRLDAARCPELRAEVDQRLAGQVHALVIDLSEATFIDSVGLAALVKAMRDAEAQESSFVIVRPRSDDAMRVFRLSKFDRVFTMRNPR
jgi:anti-sigma B factor antagonist